METRTLRLLVAVIAILLGILFFGRLAVPRLVSAQERAVAYELACDGPPLRTVERRNKAMEDGYVINKRYDCIDKAAFAAAVEEKRQREAANTTGAKEAEARAAAIKAAHDAENATLQAVAATIQPAAQAVPEPEPAVPYRALDANTAPEADLAKAFGLTPDTARQMVEERTRQPFRDWPDMIARVAGVHSARNAMFANIGGLNVNGEPLPGGPPDAGMIELARDSLRTGSGAPSR